MYFTLMVENMGNNKIVNVIRHLAFEDLGSFAPLLEARGYQINYFEAGYDDISLIKALSDDLLVILGGPISVNDSEMFPFLEAEIDMLKQRIAVDKPTLGICLGAQLIASALGARVFPATDKEIGWSDLLISEKGMKTPLRYLDANHCSMLHWHGETFELPEGGTLLASSEKCQHQAFSYGENILALQFHPEITQAIMEKWFIGHIAEIMQVPGVDVAGLRSETLQYANQLEVQSELFFNSWFNQVVSSRH